MNKTLIALALLASTTTAFAGPAADEAKTHFAAIAAGDTAILSRQYDANAQLQWIGGPLDGLYSGTDKISEVWGKFTKSQGTLKLTVDSVEEAVNPRGATVTANVQFEGKAPIKVRYVLTFRDGKVVNEVWQIAPGLKVAAGY